MDFVLKLTQDYFRGRIVRRGLSRAPKLYCANILFLAVAGYESFINTSGHHYGLTRGAVSSVHHVQLWTLKGHKVSRTILISMWSSTGYLTVMLVGLDNVVLSYILFVPLSTWQLVKTNPN